MLFIPCAGAASPPQSPPTVLTANRKDPQAIAALKAGRTTVANAAWWGFDSVDATDAIQQAIDSHAATVVVPYVGADWNVRPLRLTSRQEIIFEPGVVVAAKSGEFRGIRDFLFDGREVEHITLRGYNAVLRMRKEDYSGPGYAKSEWRHALGFYGATDITVLGLTIQSSGGDGIYLGPTEDDRRLPCRDIRIEDCACVDNHRQGISVVSAERVRIKNCVLRGTKGTSPQAGIDFEPDHPRDLMVDIEVRDCLAENNEGSGFLINLSRQSEQSRPVSIQISDSLVRGSRQPGFRALLNTDRKPTGVVEFLNCVCEDVEYAGALCAWNTASGLGLRFVNCKWRNVAKRRSEAPIVLALPQRPENAALVGIDFIGCTVYDDKDRPFAKTTGGPPGIETPAVRGDITVVNPRGGRLDAASARTLGKLRVRYGARSD